MKKTSTPILILFGVLVWGGCIAPNTALQPHAQLTDADWIGTWVSAQQITEPANLPPAPGLKDATLRQIIQPSLSGKKLRITISNIFGQTPLAISAANVAQTATGSSIQTESNFPLSFNGKPDVIIQPGALTVSDPVDFKVTALSNISVSIHIISAPSNVTGHPGSRTTSFLCSGNKVSAASLPDAAQTDHWYFLSNIEVIADRPAAAIVALGDSITDGRGSTTNMNDRWPNQLSRRLLANPATSNIAVLNQGIGGNCLLRYGLGPTALSRFDRDVLSHAGVRWLILFEGINDLGGANKEDIKSSTTIQDVISAYEQMLLRAHAHGIRVIGVTLMSGGSSFYSTPKFEADRQAVNQWIRSSGKFDAVIDFDAATRDSNDPTRLSAAVDGGDHLHPSAAGYKIMADSIDLKLFEN